MAPTDAEELHSPVIRPDMSFFDLESNHPSDSVHLLREKYAHRKWIANDVQTYPNRTDIIQIESFNCTINSQATVSFIY